MFCSALKERFSDSTSGLDKAYPRLLVDEIGFDGNQWLVTGSNRHLADALGFMQKGKLGECPTVNDWRAKADVWATGHVMAGTTLADCVNSVRGNPR